MSHNRKEIEHIVDENGCFICISHAITKDGHCSIHRNGRKYYVHRFIYEELMGKIPDDVIVRHKCDNPQCININHLTLGTHADNVRDRVERNRSALGENNGRAKLNKEKALYIRNCNLTSWELAKIFNVDPKTIRDIKQGKTWKDVG